MLIGDLKSLLPFWKNLASNQRYKPFVHDADIRYFERRFVNEGLTFITETLPLIGKALDSFHSTSEWACPPNFGMARIIEDGFLADGITPKVYEIPLFLGDAIEAAMNGDSLAVDCVRQLAYVFYKLEVDYGDEKREQFLINFRKIDSDLLCLFSDVNDLRDVVVEQMGRLIKRILCNTDPHDIIPTHGSGATACRTLNWNKHHRTLSYYEKLDNVFPYSDYFFFNPTHLADEYERLENSLPQSVPRARVCLVPKDSRGPRVISCEPAELMFIQQGIMRLLYKTIETHKLTSGQINFSDQTVNQEFARIGSKDQSYSTIDLSEASDRVSLELVRRVFPANWFEALEACRSEETELPNGEIVKLQKFAPMGSSCCFPVEALCFWACAQVSQRILGGKRQPSEVYVYGDDIICEVDSFTSIMRGLESIGLKVNANKSYWKGPFRESCGGEYHNGMDVTPIRIRKFFSKSRTSIVTNADLCNLLIAKFGYDDASSLVSVIETEGGYSYPRTELLLPATIRCSPRACNEAFFRRRFNKNLQRFEYRVLTCISESNQRQPPNWEELFRKELCKSAFSIDSSYLATLNRVADESLDPYMNPIQKLDRHADPGWYTDPHSVVTKWVWNWLG